MATKRHTKLPDPWTRGLGQQYWHPSGYGIEHCGHPTAIWPYALYGPDGKVILQAGHAWPTLQAAADEVKRRLWEAGMEPAK